MYSIHDIIEKLKTIEAELFIPSHGQPAERMDSLAHINKNKIFEILDKIQGFCEDAVTSEDVLKKYACHTVYPSMQTSMCCFPVQYLPIFHIFMRKGRWS